MLYFPLYSCQSYLAGIGIKSSLQAGLGTYGKGGGSPGDWVEGAVAGLLDGAASLSIDYLMDEVDLPPILEQFGSQLLNDIADSLIPGAANVFGNMYNSFTNYALTTGGKPIRTDAKYQLFDPETGKYEFDTDAYTSDMAQWSWKEEGYKQMSKDYTNYIKEQGLQQAMDTYGASLFDRETMDAIDSHGDSSIGLYLKDKLDNNEFEMLEWDNGIQYAKVDIMDTYDNKVSEAYFGYLAETGSWEDFMGYGNDEFQGFGDIFADPYGDLKWLSGETIDRFDAYEQMQELENGYQEHVEIKDNDGVTILVLTPNDDGEYIGADASGVTNGKMVSSDYGYEISFSDEKETIVDTPLDTFILDKNNNIIERIANQENYLELLDPQKILAAKYLATGLTGLAVDVGFDETIQGAILDGTASIATFFKDQYTILGEFYESLPDEYKPGISCTFSYSLFCQGETLNEEGVWRDTYDLISLAGAGVDVNFGFLPTEEDLIAEIGVGLGDHLGAGFFFGRPNEYGDFLVGGIALHFGFGIASPIYISATLPKEG